MLGSKFLPSKTSNMKRCDWLVFTVRQRSCEGYVFTPVCQSFCSQGGGVCLSACWDAPQDQAPPGADTFLGPGTPHDQAEQTPPPRPGNPTSTPPMTTPLEYPPPGPGTPWPGTPQSRPPQTRHPPGPGSPPPPGDGYCCGRYASWNAFLFTEEFIF